MSLQLFLEISLISPLHNNKKHSINSKDIYEFNNVLMLQLFQLLIFSKSLILILFIHLRKVLSFNNNASLFFSSCQVSNAETSLSQLVNYEVVGGGLSHLFVEGGVLFLFVLASFSLDFIAFLFVFYLLVEVFNCSTGLAI